MTNAASEIDRVTPHSLEAERAVLGGVIVDNEQFTAAKNLVDAGDFFRLAHGIIFRQISDLLSRGAFGEAEESWGAAGAFHVLNPASRRAIRDDANHRQECRGGAERRCRAGPLSAVAQGWQVSACPGYELCHPDISTRLISVRDEMRVADVPVGTLVFIACGCGGFRCPSPLAGTSRWPLRSVRGTRESARPVAGTSQTRCLIAGARSI